MKSLVVATLALITASLHAADPLPPWNDGPAKKAITAFVAKTTTDGSADFVPPAERIATFDNDGTLWSEQPMYFQAFFIFDRIKQLAPSHPEWKDKEPFASVLKDDLKTALAGGERALLEMAMASDRTIRLLTESVPIMGRAEELARVGLLPAGSHANKHYCHATVLREDGLDTVRVDLMFDAQTSGGLVLGVLE